MTARSDTPARSTHPMRGPEETDGSDLLVVARTSREGRNQHDNDLTTFHRVRNFRERATMLLPPGA